MNHEAVVRVRAVHYFLLDEPLLHVLTLITLQLNNLSHLLVLGNAAVAVERAFHRLANALEVEVVFQSLDRRNTLAPVSLLDADVDLSVAESRFSAGRRERVSGPRPETCGMK